MKKAWERVNGEPALIGGAVMAVLNMLVVLNVWNLTEAQLGAINTALGSVLALVIRATVSPQHGKPLHVPTPHWPKAAH